MADKEGARFCLLAAKNLWETIDSALNAVTKESWIIKKHQQNLSKKAELNAWINLFKKKERHGFFKPRFWFNSRTSSNTPQKLRPEVIINLGLIESNHKGIVKIKRGSKVPVKVEKIFTAEDVQKAAIKKHSETDQYFFFFF